MSAAADVAKAPDTVADIAWPWNERRRKTDGVVMASDEATHLAYRPRIVLLGGGRFAGDDRS